MEIGTNLMELSYLGLKGYPNFNWTFSRCDVEIHQKGQVNKNNLIM